MIRIRITTEAIVDAFFTVSTLAKTCTTGLSETYDIVHISMENGIVTFILDDGDETTMVDQLLEYKAVLPDLLL